VFKGARRLELKRQGRTIRTYRVALGFAPTGHKEREGDGRTPEGKYVIDGRNPRSAFHLSLRVSYPDEADKARAAARGVAPGRRHLHPRPAQWPAKVLCAPPAQGLDGRLRRSGGRRDP
jgi:hypothetical protein